MIDSHIWQLLWKCAKRRHPMKGARWVRTRYFRVDGHRSWDFATKGPADGNTSGYRLFRAMTIPITRHVKVRGLANPFDQVWTTYFARRLELTLQSRTQPHTKVAESIERRNSRGERYFSALWGCFSL
ncbi:hypothetical protein G3N58_33460 [Paraburkholderia sp. Ac-20342]|nr:hypothetical protein [Paraburkholderia sp. Ac-20342]